MKVTALIPDELVTKVQALTNGRNITDSLVIALKEWSSIQQLRILKNKVRKRPLSFSKNFTAQKVRSINREQ